jgi:hypothetical protein
MKRILIVVLGLVFITPILAQMRQAPLSAETIASSITSAELQRHLLVLASDEMEGRETGTTGQLKAAQYMAELFASWGLPAIGDNGTHFQHILLESASWQDISLTINGKEYNHLWDYYASPTMNPDSKQALRFKEVVFLGYGIDDPLYSDYLTPVEGKAIIIYDRLPQGAEVDTASWPLERRLQVAKQKGVALVLVIDTGFKENVANMRKVLASNRLKPAKADALELDYAPNVFLSSETVRQLLGRKVKKVVQLRDNIIRTGQPQNVSINVKLAVTLDKQIRSLSGHNVLGYVEGSDPILKNELIVVSAHFDHLGKRGDAIYYGADDNASGTSTVLELAQAFHEASQAGSGAKRSVLFLLVSGEEKGLLGSQYYVENPVFPLENTIANVNVDMVGRVDEKHADNPDYIYVIGADRLSSELHSINETANSTYTRLELDYTYNEESDPNRYYYRSDHYNFAERNIPAIFYFSGTHADYHLVSDTADKINFDKMVKVGHLVFHTVWELANRSQRIQVDVKK